MGKARGFLEIHRSKNPQRPAAVRIRDYREFDLPAPDGELHDQASRCMDCGIPFCHGGCPLGNLIPDWNDLVYSGRFGEASAALHATNNFPEVTGRVCPAPCEASCVLGLDDAPVTIKTIERTIADRAWDAGTVAPMRAHIRTSKRVAVVGSGPAGLAAAQQLARKGHEVVVFERSDRIGGLLRYGIPDFKLEKHIIDRRIEQMRAEGVVFRTGVDVGVDITADALRAEHDAIVLCGGATQPRDLAVPGRDLAGVHFAMEFLEQQNRRLAGDTVSRDRELLATGKRVIVLGGGDTGSDCVGTSLRQGASHVLSLELMPRLPSARRIDNPWPEWPRIYRTSSSHEEGGERDFGVLTKQIIGSAGKVNAIDVVRIDIVEGRPVERPGSEFRLACDLLLLAMGFVGPAKSPLLEQLGVGLDGRGNVATRNGATAIDGVFAAGDMARGQSLVVWAIAEGRKVAVLVDEWMMRCKHTFASPP